MKAGMNKAHVPAFKNQEAPHEVRKITAIASDAPPVMPKTEGPASGFRKITCM